MRNKNEIILNAVKNIDDLDQMSFIYQMLGIYEANLGFVDSYKKDIDELKEQKVLSEFDESMIKFYKKTRKEAKNKVAVMESIFISILGIEV